MFQSPHLWENIQLSPHVGENLAAMHGFCNNRDDGRFSNHLRVNNSNGQLLSATTTTQTAAKPATTTMFKYERTTFIRRQKKTCSICWTDYCCWLYINKIFGKTWRRELDPKNHIILNTFPHHTEPAFMLLCGNRKNLSHMSKQNMFPARVACSLMITQRPGWLRVHNVWLMLWRSQSSACSTGNYHIVGKLAHGNMGNV